MIIGMTNTEMKNNKQSEEKDENIIIKSLLNIAVLIIFTYIVMVFISHFSVYNTSETYKITDSFSALFLKTDVPAQFFLYFGAFVVTTVIIELLINLILKKKS